MKKQKKKIKYVKHTIIKNAEKAKLKKNSLQTFFLRNLEKTKQCFVLSLFLNEMKNKGNTYIIPNSKSTIFITPTIFNSLKTV